MTTDEGASSTRRQRVLWPVGVCAVTGLFAMVPIIFDGAFYMRGDTGAQFAPTWFHLGEMVRGGQWPPWLDADAWAGGNYAAEALFGIYNPVNILIWLVMATVPNLLVGVLIVKSIALMLLALGTYLVARDHGAARWAAAVVATAMPISGYTHFWDAGSWASGLIAFAYAPWVWWSFRRVLNGRLNPLWAFLVGSLAITQGNPYGTLAVVVTGVALVIEGAVTRNKAGAVRLLLLGVCVAAWLPLVYLPLLQTAGLAQRSEGMLFSNNGKLRPELGDLFGMSAPTYAPDVRAITGTMRVPAMYLCWFILPLLPWLRYGELRRRARELSGVATLSGLYLLLTLGPSKLWLFRWPIRLVEYLYLGIGVAFAVVLSKGLRRDLWQARMAATAVLVGLSGWLTWARDPSQHAFAFTGPLLLSLLTVVLLGGHYRRATTAMLAALLISGSAVVLVAQSMVFGENESSRVWHFPNDVSVLQDRFDDRGGSVMQFADLIPLQRKANDRQLRGLWDHYLAGSMYDVAHVDAVNNYTGMGYLPFTRRLCMHYDGLTKACGYRHVWKPLNPGGPALADLMKLETVVVQPKLAVGVTPATGWQVVSRNTVIIVKRSTKLPWPESHLSWVTPGVQVQEAKTIDAYHERVELSTTGEGSSLVFAMLAWPGYRATLDGEPITLEPNQAGLLTVKLPTQTSGVLDVTYRPPGLTAGLVGAGLGSLGAVLLAVAHRRRRHRGRR